MSVTEATSKGVAGLVKAAEGGRAVMVERHRRPVAAVIGADRLQELESLEEDLRDALLVLSRAATDDGRRTSLDQVLSGLGLSREDLADVDAEVDAETGGDAGSGAGSDSGADAEGDAA